MLQRLYVHNFRCLVNFELSLKGLSSSLLIGKNGVGKSTVAKVLEIFQSVGRGINRVGKLVEPKDFAHGHSDLPIRFEIEVVLEGRRFQYILAFELPDGFRELRVLEENLLMEGVPVYTREKAQVTLMSEHRQAQFLVDWHLVALPPSSHSGAIQNRPTSSFQDVAWSTADPIGTDSFPDDRIFER
jgi:ABC-type branched-subunit amino acid transport system ATPase component